MQTLANWLTVVNTLLLFGWIALFVLLDKEGADDLYWADIEVPHETHTTKSKNTDKKSSKAKGSKAVAARKANRPAARKSSR